jgi:hypothetical protein
MKINRLLLVALLVTGPAWAEESKPFQLGEAGVVKGDLTLQLYLNSLSNPVADPGIALTEDAGWYQWESLPDVEAGSTDQYYLVFSYATTGAWGSYAWPSRTQTPQAVVNRVSVEIARNPLEIVAGTTLPSAELTVFGLSSNPAGAAVVFDLVDEDGAVVIDDASASVVDSDLASDGTWSATLRHDWSGGETSALSGSYYVRFWITFSGGGIMAQPTAPNRYQVVVFP